MVCLCYVSMYYNNSLDLDMVRSVQHPFCPLLQAEFSITREMADTMSGMWKVVPKALFTLKFQTKNCMYNTERLICIKKNQLLLSF